MEYMEYMESIINCPFCGGTSSFIEKINCRHLIKIYQKYFSIDISHQFENIKFIDYLQCKECGLKFINPLITGDDDFYRKLESKEGYYPNDKFEFIFAKNLIEKTDNVLDIGAGRGMFGQNIKCNYYQGIDFSEKAIELAKNDGVNVKSIPIQEHCVDHKEFYDVIVLFQLIEHIGYDINTFLSSTIQCLKKGGKLIVSVPDNDGIIKYISNFCMNLPPHHVLFWNEKSLSFLAEKYNLTVETIYREPVTKDRKYWYYSILVNAYLNKLIFRKIAKVDTGFISSVLHFITLVLMKGIKKLKNIHKNKYGHTIVFVYQK